MEKKYMQIPDEELKNKEIIKAGITSQDDYGKLGEALKRQAELERFRAMTADGNSSKESTRILFKQLVMILNGGFDYYQMDKAFDYYRLTWGPGEPVLEGNMDDRDDYSFFLLNEEQLDKLRMVVQSSPVLDFFSYHNEDDESNVKYAVWLKDTSAYFSIVPFKRGKHDDIITRNANGEVNLFSQLELNSIVTDGIDVCEGLGYKTLKVTRDHTRDSAIV